jgi:hypothetical protein
MPGYEDHRAVETYLMTSWKQTRHAIIKRFIGRADRLLELVHHCEAFDEELSGGIVEETGRIIAEVVGEPWSSRPMWEAAIAVCPDREILVEEISRDKAVRGLRPDVAADRALAQILRCHLDARCREAIGVTEHEARVWTSLRRISDDLMRGYQETHGRFPPPGYRCCREHFRDIRGHILLHMPYDRLVGTMKTATIETYFAKFCDECRELAHRAYAEPWSDEAAGMPPYLQEEMTQALAGCVDQLDAPLRDVIHAAYLSSAPARTPDGDEGDGYVTLASDGQAFKRLKKEALRRLRRCVEHKMTERMR